MALAIGRKADQVRVLSDLSGHVVGALLDDVERGREDDPFAEALRRYRDEGAPDIGSWRSVAAVVAAEVRTAVVLRHLTRDLLKGVSKLDDEEADVEAEGTAEAPPPNVRPIIEAQEVPALELASDGTWRPSGSAISSHDELDASARRRNVPSLLSRYPQVGLRRRLDLPPPPTAARFTNVTAPPVAAPPPAVPIETPAEGKATIVVEVAAPAVMAPVVEQALPSALVDRESVIRAVAGGTEVVAGPFARFQQLAAFVKAVRALPGVQDVTTRQFVRGMVHLRVRHSHAMALVDRMSDLTEFSPSIVSSTQDRIELQVEPPDDVPPARG